jgi:arylsulfatase A-like enzyme
MHADVPNHEPSLMLMNCGESRLTRPSMGSWVTYGLGTDNQNLPGFIAMCPGGYPIKETQNWQAAFLPGVYQGTHVDTRNTSIDKLLADIRNPRIDLKDQRAQLDLVRALNEQHAAARGHDPALEARIHSFELAYRMQREAEEAFDVGREPAHIRKLYGVDEKETALHGRQTLIARRLVERGVRFVQIWHGDGQPWDNHDDIEVNHRKLAGQCDRPIAALLADLKQRGLLEETLVIWGGEFGRTPTVELPQPGANAGKVNGRDHNHYGFTTWMAGGGVRGGQVYGATDPFGFQAVENKMHVHDLHATIMHLLGFDHERLTYRYAGRDFRLTDVHGRVVTELVA